jgi:hypothetical protein
MRTHENAVCKIREEFAAFAPEGATPECLDALSAIIVRIVGAHGCTILILEEGTSASTPLLPAQALAAPYVAVVPDAAGAGESLVSAIVSRGKIVGVINVARSGHFNQDELDIFSVLVPLVTKAIEVSQLQTILKSRFTQLSIARSNESAIREMMTGVMQHPNQMARILARSFYREMQNAGFTLNQIIFAATEVISELSSSLKKRSGRPEKSAVQEQDAA